MGLIRQVRVVGRIVVNAWRRRVLQVEVLRVFGQPVSCSPAGTCAPLLEGEAAVRLHLHQLSLNSSNGLPNSLRLGFLRGCLQERLNTLYAQRTTPFVAAPPGPCRVGLHRF